MDSDFLKIPSRSKWLYPTNARELEKSYVADKFGKTLFLPKSIIEGIEDYNFEKTTASGDVYYIIRTKFLIPNWYIIKNKILHWTNLIKAKEVQNIHYSRLMEEYNICR